MVRVFRSALLVFVLSLCSAPHAGAQSAADLATLIDLKIAAKQMDMEGEGAPFRMEATFQTDDYMGRPDSQGRWTEEFAKPGYYKRTIKDGTSPEAYAPEDQANIGVPISVPTDTFMQRLLVNAFLRPGPSDAVLERSKITYKTQKVGQISLRCVLLEPLEKKKNVYLQRAAARAYCLAADKPILRLAQLGYDISVVYNSIARLGNRTFAQQLTATQRGRNRGTLKVTKLASAPELLQANLPKAEADVAETEDSPGSGGVKLDQKIASGSIITKVAPTYPLEAKQRHISGSVILHAIISKEGTIESLEVISAPADELVDASLDAVSQWRYKPYLLNGAPTEVDTTITVNFQFN